MAVTTGSHPQRVGIQWKRVPSPRRVSHSNLSENATASLGLNLEKTSLQKKKKSSLSKNWRGKVKDFCVASGTTGPEAERHCGESASLWQVPEWQREAGPGGTPDRVEHLRPTLHGPLELGGGHGGGGLRC